MACNQFSGRVAVGVCFHAVAGAYLGRDIDTALHVLAVDDGLKALLVHGLIQLAHVVQNKAGPGVVEEAADTKESVLRVGVFRIAAGLTQTTETESQTQETQTTETKKPEETQKKEETQKTEETQTTESTEKKEDTQKSDSKKSTGTVKTKDICNVRKSPSTDGELLGKVDIGVELKKLGTEGDWTKVKFQGETGYVKSEFVKEVSSKSGSGKGTVKTKDICNVRKTASTDGELLGKVDAGVKLKKLGTKGEWTKVKFQGKTGYIKSDLLKTVK